MNKSMRDMENVTLSRDSFDEVIELLGIGKIKCDICNVELTKDNFCILRKDSYCCDNKLCMQAFIALDGLNECSHKVDSTQTEEKK